MKFTVIGLLGPAGSGKDLVADWFTSNKNFVKVALADPMKRFCQKAFGFTEKQLWGPSEERNAEFAIDEAWWLNAVGHMPGATHEILNEVLQTGVRVDGYMALMGWFSNLRKTYPEKISARVVLQTLGTEWGRSVDPLMWAKYAHRVAHRIDEGHFYTQVGGIRERRPGEVSALFGAIIPDHRFANELATTQEAGGYVIRLRRLAQEEQTIGIAGHRSESEHKTLLDDAFDLVLEFPEGVEKVHEILEKVFV